MAVKTTAIRVGASGSSSMFNDEKLEDMTKVLSYSLENSPESTVVGDCVTALETVYGAGNVSDVAATPRYIWEWDPVTNTWIKRCVESTTINVDDGEPNDGRLVISIVSVVN